MIGVLKSLGANNLTIRKLFLWLAVFLIGKGMLWGNVIGLAFYFIQKWFGLFRLDPETYYMDTVPVSFNLWLFLLLNVGTLLASIAMLLGPSYLITRIQSRQIPCATSRVISHLFSQEFAFLSKQTVELPAERLQRLEYIEHGQRPVVSAPVV